ncbi:dual serine/threonine and tyrosine protein kinase-like [Ptychodera flava]|uniref:dual serine/threonine and tyrosine protein kinase-like n=1 Tax=Ptychodera flava TaxID=63121 RepID=UPI003969C8E1
MFQLLTDFVKSAEMHMKLGTVVQDSIARVKPGIIIDAETRELPDEFVYHEFDEPELKPLVKMIQSLTDAKSITAHAFCRDVCNVIINKVTNEVRREATALLKSEFSTSMKRVILTVYALELPALRCTFEKAYASEVGLDEDRKSKKKETSRLLIQVATTLSAGIRRALQTHLDEVYSTESICAMVNKLKIKMKTKNEQQWRTRIANELLSSLDATQLADSIRQACKGHLNEVHNAFTVSLEQLCVLNSELTKPHEQLKVKMRDVFVPMVADLKVRGYALQYEIKYGKLKVGSKLGEGSRCRINECKAAGNWPCLPSKLAVKVVASEDKLGRKNESWNETMVTLHCIRSIKFHENLLSVYGWVIPRPGKLYIAVEKVKTDLQSLMEGASLELTSRIRMASNVASGLAALHKQGIIHGDLKPQNILVKFDESSGWSALINTCKPKAIFAPTALGEPFHIAPYLYEDSKRQRVFGDVYAFGMLLWFLCDGNCRRPDVYDKYTTRETMKIAVAEKAIRPKRPEECDSALWGLMKQCWMEEKRLTLDDILERLGI